MRQGGTAEYYYLILSGKVSVYALNPENGFRVNLATLGDGEAFGEIALLSEAKRSATVETLLQTGFTFIRRLKTNRAFAGAQR